MRPRTDSQMPIRRAPKKLAAIAPVSSRIAALRTTPSPGMRKPFTASGRALSGNRSSVWSSVLIRNASTQIVMPSGTQTSRPAIRWRLRVTVTPAGTPSMAGHVVAGPAGGVLEGSAAALLDSAFDSVLDSAGFEPPSLSPVDLAAGLDPELLKSVAYQPLPLSWNPAAVTSLLRAGLPQAGHARSSGSESFCSASSSCPQSEQRYS